jgi:hypothetical protein
VSVHTTLPYSPPHIVSRIIYFYTIIIT